MISPPSFAIKGIPSLASGSIHVCFAVVDQLMPEIREFEALLSQEETARAQRFRSEQDRDRYIVQHGLLRSLLAGYLGCRPRQVDIRSSPHGKPCLAGKDGEGSLQFNLSHSDGVAAYAFIIGKSIGVDIEKIHEFPEMEERGLKNSIHWGF